MQVELRTTTATTSVAAQSVNAVGLGKETHVVATYDGHVIRIYLNGILDRATGAQATSLPNRRRPPTS